MEIDKIQYCKIHPGIGIARLGDSRERDGYFIGPEVPGPQPLPKSFKDAKGCIKRQAARFRVYAYDEDGRALGEITATDATIQWTVELANKKASWRQFKSFYDRSAITLRNPKIADRRSLEITPGSRTISGKDRARGAGGSTEFVGRFRGEDVLLGELRTDADGRLLVLGGNGTSRTVDPKTAVLKHYANNDGWNDDTSDGPVTATVTFPDGRGVPVDGAWVICAPPKYAPHARSIVTLYDVMMDVETTRGGVPALGRSVSFENDVWPIFQRMFHLSWLNGYVLRGHGAGAFGDFFDAGTRKKLYEKTPASAEWRRQIFRRIREPGLDPKSREAIEQASEFFMPQLFGDDGDEATEGEYHRWLTVTRRQYEILKLWGQDAFDRVPDDFDFAPKPSELESLPAEDQCKALDRASLEACAGGAFLPGIEMTYIAREPDLYPEPFRMNGASKRDPSWGGGTLEPGDITKWMAVPWQADFYQCRDRWWPAVRPDQVVTSAIYESALALAAVKSSEPDDDPGRTFARLLAPRADWERGLSGDGYEPMNAMVRNWSKLGFVVPRKPVKELVPYVESERGSFEGSDLRRQFYQLLNIDDYPDFIAESRDIVRRFIDDAWAKRDQDAYLAPFPYSSDGFDARLKLIYDQNEQDGRAFTPGDDEHIKRRADAVYRLVQMAPFNQLDGEWLQRAVPAGPLDGVREALAEILRDEVGDGRLERNHANLYTTLLNQLGYFFPDVRSEAYANDPRFLDEAFQVPVFLLALALSPDHFLPELLGVTLSIEWTVLDTLPFIALLEYYGIDAKFFTMHVAIDNASAGHGAKSQQLVKEYLDGIRDKAGKQAEWQRIWRGFVALQTGGDLYEAVLRAVARPANSAQSPEETAVLSLIETKRPIGELNHGSKQLGINYINDLFGNPPALLQALRQSTLVIDGDPDNSEFLTYYVSFEGPMFHVFTDEELDVWRRWIRSLARSPKVAVTGSYEQMAGAVRALQERQTNEPQHRTNKLYGFDENNEHCLLSVSQWLTKDPQYILAAIKDPCNGLVIVDGKTGDAGASVFISTFLSYRYSMGRIWSAPVPHAGGATWREVAVEWVRNGCPLPAASFADGDRAAGMHDELGAGAFARRSLPSPQRRRHALRQRGMGAVH